MTRPLRIPSLKKPRYVESDSSGESTSDDDYFPQDGCIVSSSFYTDPLTSHVKLSSSLLGLCLYHCMNLRIPFVEQFVSGRDRDLKKICFFLSKYDSISINFRHSVVFALSIWIRNHQTTIDLRSNLKNQKTLISKLNLSSFSASTSILAFPKQMILYLEGTRSLKYFTKILNPDIIVSINLIGSCRNVFKGSSIKFPFENLKLLKISCPSSWKKITWAMENFEFPNLISLKLLTSPTSRGSFDDLINFPNSFQNIKELEIEGGELPMIINLGNLISLNCFKFSSEPSNVGHVIQGTSELLHLKSLILWSFQPFEVHHNVGLLTLHYYYDESIFRNSFQSNLIELKLTDNSKQIVSSELITLDFKKFTNLERLFLHSIRCNSLEISQNSKLSELYIDFCNISSINFAEFSLLNVLQIFNLVGFSEYDEPCILNGLDYLNFLSKFHVVGSSIYYQQDWVIALSNLIDLKGFYAFFKSNLIESILNLRILELNCIIPIFNVPFLPNLKKLTLTFVNGNSLRLFTPEKIPKLEKMVLNHGDVGHKDFNFFENVLNLELKSIEGLGEFEFLQKFPNLFRLYVDLDYCLEISQINCFLQCPKLMFLQINSISKNLSSISELAQLKRLEFLIINFSTQSNAKTAPEMVNSLRSLMPNTMIFSKSDKPRQPKPLLKSQNFISNISSSEESDESEIELNRFEYRERFLKDFLSEVKEDSDFDETQQEFQ
ncbi:hypothetical protein RCL1_002705 [Eukaryota sp. TZLM3-RCL]